MPAAGPADTSDTRSGLYLRGFLDQVISPGALAPAERDYIARSKTMLDQLSAECGRMLARTVADPVGPVPAPTKDPAAAASSPAAAVSEGTNDARDAAQQPSNGGQPAYAAGSLIDRLARLEARLEQLAQVIGRS
jgi:hypothetical protein